MADTFLGLADDVPAGAMRHRPVAVLDCLWQVQLEMQGFPLGDRVQYRMLCLLRPSAPAVAVAACRLGRRLHMDKQFRRLDVLRRGDLIALSLTFQTDYTEPGARYSPFLRLYPTQEPDLARTLSSYEAMLWRTAAAHERPDAASVFLSPGVEIMTGQAFEVATIAPDVRAGMLLVDLDDVKGLRSSRWRLRQASAAQDSVWRMLTTGVGHKTLTVPSE
jgi:hypothetical protein